MKSIISTFQRHLGVTRSEAVAVSFIAAVVTIGTIGSHYWPSTDLHDHVTASRIGQIIDSLEADRSDTISQNGTPITAPALDEPLVKPAVLTRRSIDLNLASFAQLEMLPGIGPAMAQRIIDARKRRRFTCPDDLLDVKGIGEKKLNKLRPFVRVP